jgi:hypothetical protein
MRARKVVASVAMDGPDSNVAIYRLHVLLQYTHPPVWRLLRVRSDSSLADLHEVIQIFFGWSDAYLHRFSIRAKQYGIPHIGGLTFSRNARCVQLAEFRWRLNERFDYEYDLSAPWRHQVRIEGIEPMTDGKVFPVCIGGAGAAPSEECGGPEAWAAYLEDDALRDPPLSALEHLATVVSSLVDARDDETVRAGMDMEALQQAVGPGTDYLQRRPDRFDRRRLNRRLRLHAEGDECWRVRE